MPPPTQSWQFGLCKCGSGVLVICLRRFWTPVLLPSTGDEYTREDEADARGNKWRFVRCPSDYENVRKEAGTTGDKPIHLSEATQKRIEMLLRHVIGVR